MARLHHSTGFTLIELSIVLVIIGLIVGGLLVGKNMVKSARVRAQISQIEKFQTAVTVFDNKFAALPGDMPTRLATQYGFTVGAGCNGGTSQRDGNGLIDGGVPYQLMQSADETALFWQDLSSSQAGNLIEGQFPNSGAPAITCTAYQVLTTTVGTSYIGDYFPAAKMGQGNFVYVYETGGYNWYGVAEITYVTGATDSSAIIPVIQAYDIDKKIDDGLPTTGQVQATYYNSSITSTAISPAPNAAFDSPTTCYNTTSNTYSVSSPANYGAGGNCALSFQF